MTKKDSECLIQRILRLTGVAGHKKSTFAELLQTFVHRDFSEDEAVYHWERVLENMDRLSEKLGEPVSVYFSIMEYFTNGEHAFSSPLLVEVNDFRRTEHLAMIDGLTGVFNRRYMDIILRKEFNRCDRYGKTLSICIIDIDDFKEVNDTRGHLFGDDVLREFASLIQATLRDEDILCRYGGEEFLVVLPETDSQGAYALAGRIRDAVKAAPLFRDNRITFSGGTATYPATAYDIASLIDSADRALYQAKYDGKDCIAEASRERRKFGRYQFSWDIAVYQEGANVALNGLRTQNISLGGFQFECSESFSVDTKLYIEFQSLEPDRKNVMVNGKITWAQKKLNRYYYGVKFLESTVEIEAMLGNTEAAFQTAI